MKKNIFISILLPLVVLIFSCSSASDELPGANIEKISNPDVNLELEDITSLGFKKNKTYKVKDLPEAKSAYYGFLKIPKTKESIDYELRFYENQEKALSIGVDWVEERIGKDAILTKGDATWKEGVQDARTCGGDSGHGAGYSLVVASSTCNLAKYFDYFVYGNMIILCQGKDIEQSVNNCRFILSKLENTPQ